MQSEVTYDRQEISENAIVNCSNYCKQLLTGISALFMSETYDTASKSHLTGTLIYLHKLISPLLDSMPVRDYGNLIAQILAEVNNMGNCYVIPNPTLTVCVHFQL